MITFPEVNTEALQRAQNERYRALAFSTWERERERLSDRVADSFAFSGQEFLIPEWSMMVLYASGQAAESINKQQWDRATAAVGSIMAYWVRIGYRVHLMDTRPNEIVADSQASVLGFLATLVEPRIKEQIQHHFDKYASQRLDPANWSLVIQEEEHEALAEIFNGNYEAFAVELAQVLACYLRLIVEIHRQESGAALEEEDQYVRAV